ncbi:MAG TPA: 50S ribosomal protein L13 [Myxococcaceae bacterium]|jgi:large subunit ribosomal protein L13|nr:50S ribosomal protein L13 [Myxococcaceae bacterium]
MSQRTYSARPADIKREWHVVDVADKVLGRAASQIATLLKGKHKAIYTPSMDTGDHVIVINAAKVRVTGTKETNKRYYRHPRAGFPGALKITTLQRLRERHPEDIIVNAVRRMLPRNALGRKMMTKLKVYPGAEHPHQAQQPKAREVEA